ncbi:hypothetical protein [Ornithinibacillus californiensis]|uniref:hypothetical protein n=1 Tax=Ornithinibacillus californiensis TaxID=161536 RepID=UPI00064DFEC7|nr:hypothetical protein [Ornithinibacillus californiensis]
MAETLYFHDNFFSSGTTDIYNSQKEIVGTLDLKSAFSDGVDVLDPEGTLQLRGYFPFFSHKWNVVNSTEDTVGILRARFALFRKLFEYEASDQGFYTIESEAFSREYSVLNPSGSLICEFKRVDDFFESPAFQLINYSDTIPSIEWITIVMGVNAIQKRRRRNNAAAT